MQGTSWAAGLELVGDDERLAAHAGLLPLRLLAEGTGLRAGLSAAMRRRGSSPLYDRGQLLADLALVLIAGAYLVIPAALRRRCVLRPGDRVLLAAFPAQDALAAYSFAVVDQALRAHAPVPGEGRRP